MFIAIIARVPLTSGDWLFSLTVNRIDWKRLSRIVAPEIDIRSAPDLIRRLRIAESVPRRRLDVIRNDVQILG